MNTCTCGHIQDEHEYGIHQCWQCDCEAFKASTGEKHELKDWDGE